MLPGKEFLNFGYHHSFCDIAAGQPSNPTSLATFSYAPGRHYITQVIVMQNTVFKGLAFQSEGYYFLLVDAVESNIMNVVKYHCIWY